MEQIHGWQGVSAALGGVCRSKVFELWRTGELGSLTIGRRRFSTDEQIEVYVARRLADVSNHAAAVAQNGAA